MKPGDRVLYDGPHDEGYLPFHYWGTVEHIGPKRSQVRYSWGCHLILNSRLVVLPEIVDPEPNLIELTFRGVKRFV